VLVYLKQIKEDERERQKGMVIKENRKEKYFNEICYETDKDTVMTASNCFQRHFLCQIDVN
jgi:hypothetical protein